MASIATMAAEKAVLCVFFEEYAEPDDISLNTWLVIHNTLDVAATALANRKSREPPSRVKQYVATVVPCYRDPTFASHFRMTRQTFQVKEIPLLTFETVL